MKPIARSLAGMLAVIALLGACGDDDAGTGTGAAPTSTTVAEGATGDAGRPATDAGDAPERIVSLSPTGTEILFAVGAGDQVVAVDEQSDFPEEAPITDLSGFEPNLEAIVAHEPDLVVATGLPEDVVRGLEAVDAEVFDVSAPTELDEVYQQITDIGIVTGHEDGAADVVARMRSEIEALAATVPDRTDAPTYYHELDDTLYTVTSSTFVGRLYALAGLENVADAADADGALGGYPQVSPEFLVQADPDYVFLADTECCGQDADTFAARPGFGDLTAVREGNVVELSDDVASRWGPRLVDLFRAIVEATAA